jgi:hypothetical protein
LGGDGLMADDVPQSDIEALRADVSKLVPLVEAHEQDIQALVGKSKLPTWAKAGLLVAAGLFVWFSDPSPLGMAAGVALIGAGVAAWAGA